MARNRACYTPELVHAVMGLPSEMRGHVRSMTSVGLEDLPGALVENIRSAILNEDTTHADCWVLHLRHQPDLWPLVMQVIYRTGILGSIRQRRVSELLTVYMVVCPLRSIRISCRMEQHHLRTLRELRGTRIVMSTGFLDACVVSLDIQLIKDMYLCDGPDKEATVAFAIRGLIDFIRDRKHGFWSGQYSFCVDVATLLWDAMGEFPEGRSRREAVAVRFAVLLDSALIASKVGLDIGRHLKGAMEGGATRLVEAYLSKLPDPRLADALKEMQDALTSMEASNRTFVAANAMGQLMCTHLDESDPGYFEIVAGIVRAMSRHKRHTYGYEVMKKHIRALALHGPRRLVGGICKTGFSSKFPKVSIDKFVKKFGLRSIAKDIIFRFLVCECEMRGECPGDPRSCKRWRSDTELYLGPG